MKGAAFFSMIVASAVFEVHLKLWRVLAGTSHRSLSMQVNKTVLKSAQLDLQVVNSNVHQHQVKRQKVPKSCSHQQWYAVYMRHTQLVCESRHASF